MCGYKGLATYITFNFKREDEIISCFDLDPFDACCYTITKTRSISCPPNALDLHLVTI
jgi:hypothetical protein